MNRDEGHSNPRETEGDRPLARLRDLREEPDARFLTGLRARINRRLLAADSLDFVLTVMSRTLMNYVDLIVIALTGKRPRRGGES